MKTLRVRFSFLWSVLELTVWVVLILVPATLLFLEYRNEPGLHRIGTIDVTIPRDHLLSFAVEGVAVPYVDFFSALNFPGLIVEILVSLPPSWPDSWLLGALGSLLCVLCLVVLCGIWFGVSEHEDGESLIFWGLGMWGLGFGVLPAAWLRQRLGKNKVTTVGELV
jgi:hypothetical protein